MKKALKLAALVLSLAMVLALAACGGAAGTAPAPSAAPSEAAPSEAAPADNFPEKPIELYVPYSPGGQTDLAARALAKNVSKYLPNNQSVVVVNVPGASGMTGANQYFSTPNDGYTLLMTTNSPVTLFTTTEELDYEYDDILPLMQVITMPQCMQTKAGSKWGQAGGEAWLKDLQASGATWKYATVGLGNGQHLSVEAMAKAVGISAEPVSYGSFAEGQQATIQGAVDGVVGAPTNWDPSQTDILICFAGERSKQYPDVPTIKELGYDFSIEFFVGLVCQTGTPENRVDILCDAFQKAMEDPDTVSIIENIPMEMKYLGRDEFKAYCDEERVTYADLSKELGFIS